MTNTSIILAALEQAWEKIRKQHKDVPAAILVVASGSKKGSNSLTLGHYAEGRWATKRGKKPTTPEVLISGEGFQRSGVEVLGTLLHEAAHGMAATRGVKDTSRGGRYHNQIFKQYAEELGLTVEQDGTRGWSYTEVPPATQKRWKETIKNLNKAIKTFRFAEGSGKKKSSNRQLLAVCKCGTKIRLSRAAYEKADIVCLACSYPFRVVE